MAKNDFAQVTQSSVDVSLMIQQLDRAKRSLVDYQRTAKDGFVEPTNQMSESAKTATKAVGSMQDAVSRLAGIAAFDNMKRYAGYLEEFAGGMLSAAGAMQTFKVQYTGLLGSGFGTKLLGELQQMAVRTPFEYMEIVQAGQQFAGLWSGLSREKLTDKKYGITGAVRAAGELSAATSYGLEESMRTLARMRLPGARWKNTVVGQFLSPQLGGMEGSGEQVYNAAIDLIVNRFGGMMERQMGTLAQAISNLRDAVIDLAVNSGGVGLAPVAGGVYATKGLVDFARNIPGVSTALGVAGMGAGALGVAGSLTGMVGLGALTYSQAASSIAKMRQNLGMQEVGNSANIARMERLAVNMWGNTGRMAVALGGYGIGGMLGAGLGGGLANLLGVEDSDTRDAYKSYGAGIGGIAGGIGAWVFGSAIADVGKSVIFGGFGGMGRQFRQHQQVNRFKRLLAANQLAPLLSPWEFSYKAVMQRKAHIPPREMNEMYVDYMTNRGEAMISARRAAALGASRSIADTLGIGAEVGATTKALGAAFGPAAAVAAGAAAGVYLFTSAAERGAAAIASLQEEPRYNALVSKIASERLTGADKGGKVEALFGVSWGQSKTEQEIIALARASGNEAALTGGILSDSQIEQDIQEEEKRRKLQDAAAKTAAKAAAKWGYRTDSEASAYGLVTKTRLTEITSSIAQGGTPGSLGEIEAARIRLGEAQLKERDAIAKAREELASHGYEGMVGTGTFAMKQMTEFVSGLSASQQGDVNKFLEDLAEASKNTGESLRKLKDTTDSAASGLASAFGARLGVAESYGKTYGTVDAEWAKFGVQKDLEYWRDEMKKYSGNKDTQEYQNAQNQYYLAQIALTHAAALGPKVDAETSRTWYSFAASPDSGISNKELDRLGKQAIIRQMMLAQAYGTTPMGYAAGQTALEMTEAHRDMMLSREIAEGISPILESRLGKAINFLETPSLAIRSEKQEAQNELDKLRKRTHEFKPGTPEYVDHISKVLDAESKVAQLGIQEKQAIQEEKYADNILKDLETRPLTLDSSQEELDIYKDAKLDYDSLAGMSTEGLSPDELTNRAKAMRADKRTMARSRSHYAMARGSEATRVLGLAAMQAWRPGMSRMGNLQYGLRMANAALIGGYTTAAIAGRGGLRLEDEYQNQRMINQALKDRYEILKGIASLPFQENIDRMQNLLAYTEGAGYGAYSTSIIDRAITGQKMEEYKKLKSKGYPEDDPRMLQLSKEISGGLGRAQRQPILAAQLYGAEASAMRAWASLQPGMEAAMASGALPPQLRQKYMQQYGSFQTAYNQAPRGPEGAMLRAELSEMMAGVIRNLKGTPSGEWAGTYMGKLINLSQGRAAGSMLELARQGVVLGVSKSQHEITLKIGFDNIPMFLNESYIGQIVNQAVYNILSNAGSRGTQTRR